MWQFVFLHKHNEISVSLTNLWVATYALRKIVYPNLVHNVEEKMLETIRNDGITGLEQKIKHLSLGMHKILAEHDDIQKINCK